MAHLATVPAAQHGTLEQLEGTGWLSTLPHLVPLCLLTPQLPLQAPSHSPGCITMAQKQEGSTHSFVPTL